MEKATIYKMVVHFNDTVVVYNGDSVDNIVISDRQCRPANKLERDFNFLIEKRYSALAKTLPHYWPMYGCGTHSNLMAYLSVLGGMTTYYVFMETKKILDYWKKSRRPYILDYKGSYKLICKSNATKKQLHMWLLGVVCGTYTGEYCTRYDYVATLIQKYMRGAISRNKG